MRTPSKTGSRSRKPALAAKVAALLDELRAMASEKMRLRNCRRFEIPKHRMLGIAIEPVLKLARGEKRNHALAEGLWRTGLFEARIAATQIEVPTKVTVAQMQRWSRAFGTQLIRHLAARTFAGARDAPAAALRWLRGSSADLQSAALHMLAWLPKEHRRLSPAWYLEQLPPLLRLASAASDELHGGASGALNAWAMRDPEIRARVLAAARRLLGARGWRRQTFGLSLLLGIRGRLHGEDLDAAMKTSAVPADEPVRLTGRQYSFMTALMQHDSLPLDMLPEFSRHLRQTTAADVCDELRSLGLISTVERPGGARGPTYCQLTDKGGATWEAFTQPDWAGFVQEQGAYEEQAGVQVTVSVVTSMDRRLAEDYAMLLSKAPRESLAIRWIGEWQATTWRRLPFGCEVTVSYPHTVDLEHRMEAVYWHRQAWRRL